MYYMKFYTYRNEHLLPPKPRLTLRYLKKDILDFHSKFVLVPADKAANNIIIVWRIHYINVLPNELNSTYAYSKISASENDIVNNHITYIPILESKLNKKNSNFLLCIGFLNYIKNLQSQIHC
jgi:hypothetical protein